MAIIQLTKRGQHLIVKDKVKIAEGNINSVQLEVYMNDDDFSSTSGTAIFSNDKVENDKTYSVCLNIPEIPGSEMPDRWRRICTVPHEVLSEDGVLSISLEFVGGGVVEKTTIAKLNVLKSLKHDETVVEPSMNLYLQYLDAIDQLVDPWSTAMRAEYQTLMEEHAELFAQRMQELDTYMQGVELWKNSDVTVPVTTLTIPIDRTQYKRLHIEAYTNVNDDDETSRVLSPCVCIHSNGVYHLNSGYSSQGRLVTVSDTSIEISENSSTNTAMIPYRIIGYRY